MKWRYYRCLFKHNGEPWSVEKELPARSIEEAFEEACKYAERNGFDDFTVM